MCPACRFDRCDDTATRCRQCGADLTVEDEDEGHPSLASAWFHYLQVPELGTVELVPGRAFLMGNDPRADLLLKRCPDKEAARVFWTADFDEATVQPVKGSKWTVKVDGLHQARDRVLKGGEEVSLGPLHFKYLKKATPIEGARKLSRKSKAPPGAGVGVGTTANGTGRAGGALDPNQRSLRPVAPSAPASAPAKSRGVAQAPPSRVAAAIEKTKGYGTLRVSGRQGRGWVSIMKGAPVHAAYGELHGIRALEAILRLGPCQVTLDEGLPKRGAARDAIEGISFSQVLAKLAGPSRPAPSSRPGPGPSRPTRPGPGRPGGGPGGTARGPSPRPGPGRPPSRRPPGR